MKPDHHSNKQVSELSKAQAQCQEKTASPTQTDKKNQIFEWVSLHCTKIIYVPKSPSGNEVQNSEVIPREYKTHSELHSLIRKSKSETEDTVTASIELHSFIKEIYI